MVEIELDGQKIEVQEGCMVMHAAEKAGTYIPHFCYHKKLSIAANCRMCLVDVEKAPKPMPACATPVTQGMVVRTKSDKAIAAQKSVMEFLLINHPLDCPICDQGGECQLQDIAVGYGGSSSRYEEEKRVVFHKNVGPLISMEEMSRCIHCTRCVRFGQEIAGVMELGMVHRGEHSEITTVVGETIDSELSGNMIDICPVGALTSKPFRYSARTWELSRRRSISPHDSSGANLIVQVKNNEVMRIVPLENEDVNECWIADRDRYSYESLRSQDRLTRPMLKQGGSWHEVSWEVAIEYVVNGIRDIQREHGCESFGALVSPHSTLEELYLTSALVRGIGSDNIDFRLRNLDFTARDGAHWLGTSIASLSSLQSVLVVGSNLRKDHPLFAQRVRQAVRSGGEVSMVHDENHDWAMPIQNKIIAGHQDWLSILGSIAIAVAVARDIAPPPYGDFPAVQGVEAIAQSLLRGERKAIFLGNAVAHHAQNTQILVLANWLAQNTGATVGYLTEAANTVGAQLAGAMPIAKGLNASEMLSGRLQATLLLNVEPRLDGVISEDGISALAASKMVITMSPFKSNMDFSDVLLPISPFSETSGSFVNAEGRLQSFHAVVKPLGETRPAWKILRVLANMLGLNHIDFESSQEVLEQALLTEKNSLPAVDSSKLSNNVKNLPSEFKKIDSAKPVVASIYQLDALVRRSPSLQRTSDARTVLSGGGA